MSWAPLPRTSPPAPGADRFPPRQPPACPNSPGTITTGLAAWFWPGGSPAPSLVMTPLYPCIYTHPRQHHVAGAGWGQGPLHVHPPAPGYRANADLAGKEIFWEEAELKTQPCLLTHPRNLTLKREIFIPSAAVSWASSLTQTWGVLGRFAHSWPCTQHCRALAPSHLQVVSSSAYAHSCTPEQIKTISPLISCLRNIISCLRPGRGTQPCPLALSPPGSCHLALLWPGILPCILGTSCF